ELPSFLEYSAGKLGFAIRLGRDGDDALFGKTPSGLNECCLLFRQGEVDHALSITRSGFRNRRSSRVAGRWARSGNQAVRDWQVLASYSADTRATRALAMPWATALWSQPA